MKHFLAFEPNRDKVAQLALFLKPANITFINAENRDGVLHCLQATRLGVTSFDLILMNEGSEADQRTILSHSMMKP